MPFGRRSRRPAEEPPEEKPVFSFGGPVTINTDTGLFARYYSAHTTATHWSATTTTSGWMTTTAPLAVTRERIEAAEREEIRRRQAVAAELAAREQARQQEKRKRVENGQKNGLEWLESLLTEEEKIVFNHGEGKLIIKGSDERYYSFRRNGDWVGNILLLDAHGCNVERWCVHPNQFRDDDGYNHPINVSLGMQVIWLRTDASFMENLKNHYGPDGCQGTAGPSWRRRARKREREILDRWFPPSDAPSTG